MSALRCDAHFGTSDRRCIRPAGHSQPLHTIPGEISWPDTLVMRRSRAARFRSGELFAGVGGLGMAVDEVFNATPAWFCEFDAAPSKVLAHHFPNVPNFGDVRSVDWSTTERVDILAGGFPCQDVSLAGRRRGMNDGTRSGLWSEFAKAIDEIRPDWVVIENVRGLLSADAAVEMESCPLCVGDDPEHVLRALGAVLGDLAELGFDAEWVGLRAADIGAPHGRFRVFILAWPRERVASDAVRAPVRGRTGGIPRTARAFEAAGNQWERGGHPTGYRSEDASLALLPTPDAYAGSRGGSQHPEKKRAGNHMVTLQDVAEFTLLPTPSVSNSHGNEVNGRGEPLLPGVVHLLPTPNVAMADGGQTSRSGDRKGELLLGGVAAEHATEWGPYAAAIARWERIVDRHASSPVRLDGKNGKARLNPQFTEWMMGWPAGWVTAPDIGLSRAEQLKACGNGVVPQQAAAALRVLLARPGVPALFESMAVAS
ncbi:DNA cytosine methyltransferase [Microbacterium sp. NPDC087592]|uniref:DNA cytosine methyltransferase n=1 Tax=Microbacterium sp. NPDC087592 TaxID=3364193 RepID=UPI00382271EC